MKEKKEGKKEKREREREREEKEKEGSVTREESKSERLLPHGEG